MLACGIVTFEIHTMSATGPNDFNLEQVQLAVVDNFDTLINQQPGEVGSCKKMVRLSCLNPTWQHLAVVYAKEPSEFSKAMVFKEQQLLAHLTQQAYPIVEVFGSVFKVQGTKERERYGMIQRYIPGVFIEAKTPAPLKLLLTAALLNLPARAQEGWLVFHQKTLTDQISTALENPQNFADFKVRANHLSLAFRSLIDALKDKQEKIHDLQMIISPDGTLTVIDPLDVICIGDDKSWKSLIEGEDLSGPSIKQFIEDTTAWLLSAEQFCQLISVTASAVDVTTQCTQMTSVPLFYRTTADKRGTSRVNQLRSEAASASPSLAFSSDKNATFKKK